MKMEINTGGGGINIDGVIEQAKAKGVVTAGDFVKLVEEISVGEDTQLSAEKDSGTRMSAVELTENKVLIAYSYSGNYYPYTMICTINGTTITVESNTQLSTTVGTGLCMSTVKLTENKVLIAHSHHDKCVHGMICVINEDNVITVESDTKLTSAGNNIVSIIKTMKLSENKVLMAYVLTSSSSISDRLYVCIYTVNNNTITAETSVLIATSSFYTVSIAKLAENSIFIVWDRITNYINGAICKINEDTITIGATTQLNADETNKAVVVALTLNKVLIIYAGKNDILYGMICSIDGTTVTVESDTTLSTQNYTGTGISVLTLSHNKVLIMHSDTQYKYYLCMMLCAINEKNIEVLSDTQLSNKEWSGYYMQLIKLSKDKIYLSHASNGNNSNHLYGVLIDYFELAQLLTSSTDEISRNSKNIWQ